MNSQIQLVATLVSFGNAFLRKCHDAIGFFPSHSVFTETKEVLFKEMNFAQKAEIGTIANNPLEWFNYLRESGCIQLSLAWVPINEDEPIEEFTKRMEDMTIARTAAGAAGFETTYFIRAIFSDGEIEWFWKFGGASVVFGSTLKKTPIKSEFLSNLTEDIEKLQKVLIALEKFTKEKQLDNWHKIFTDAIGVFDIKASEIGEYWKNFFPPGCVSIKSLLLFIAAESADVFGAMGSWNDLSFKEEKDWDEYETLTEELVKIVRKSKVDAVNSTGRHT